MNCESNQDQAGSQGDGLVEDDYTVGQDVVQLTTLLNEFLTSPEGMEAKEFLGKKDLPFSIDDIGKEDLPGKHFFVDYALTAHGFGRCIMEMEDQVDDGFFEEYQPVQPQELAEVLLKKTGNIRVTSYPESKIGYKTFTGIRQKARLEALSRRRESDP